MRSGVPRRTESRAGRPMETVHIDLAGPYEASMGGSLYLIMFVDSASRWMRPYGMKRKSETTAFCWGLPGAVYSRRIPTESQQST